MNTTVKINIAAQYPLSPVLKLQSPSGDIAYSIARALADGIGVNQADRLFSDQRTLVASTNEDLDFAGSALTDAFGRVFTIVKIKVLVIVAALANVNNVQIRRGATNGIPIFTAVSSGVDLGPGGIFMWASPSAGVVVTPATGDLVNVANSGAGTSVIYDVVAIGTSA
jgi:hypothetical protein